MNTTPTNTTPINIIPIDITPTNTIPTNNTLTESWLIKLFDYIHKPGIMPRFGKVGFYTLIFIIICSPMYYVLPYMLKPRTDSTNDPNSASNKKNSSNTNQPGYMETQYTNFKFDTYNLYLSLNGSKQIRASKPVINKPTTDDKNKEKKKAPKQTNLTLTNLIYSLIFGWIGFIICMIIIT